ncbi:hypothetical protein L7F22_021343 [Adiantum nelumboides]|nr:hypothetical protein [Adiantum nelumboides]
MENGASFPIRLIEVIPTISSLGHVCFSACVDWNFHVISHTWSLQIRDLSTEIGKYVVEANALNYEMGFCNTDFREKPGYAHLVAFLRLLSNDGVEKVWLDALCINQTDSLEKAREIQNMGAYYSNSIGCYVCVHGFGQGYDLWRTKYKADNDEIVEYTPRWFTRVCTLQEYLLPKTLTFIIGGIKKWVKTYVNRCIRNQKSEVGLCKCCTTIITQDFSTTTSIEGILSCCGGEVGQIMANGKVGVIEGASLEEEVLERNAVCLLCRTSPLVRFASYLAPGETLYFVDREAYIFLLSLAQWSLSDEISYLRNLRYRSFFSMHRLLDRLWALMKCDSVRYSTIVDEVSQRDCSVEEDHILGILGLLQVDSKTHLRTGKTLEKQIVDVLRCCSHDVVIELCAVDHVGSSSFKGMSWVPELKMNWLSRFSIPAGRIQRLAEVVDVSEAGILTLSSRILYGLVVPQQYSGDNQYVSLWKPSAGERTSLRRLWLLCKRKGYYEVGLKRGSVALGNLRLYEVKLKNSNDHGMNQKFPMWIMLLGDFTDF